MQPPQQPTTTRTRTTTTAFNLLHQVDDVPHGPEAHRTPGGPPDSAWAQAAAETGTAAAGFPATLPGAEQPTTSPGGFGCFSPDGQHGYGVWYAAYSGVGAGAGAGSYPPGAAGYGSWDTGGYRAGMAGGYWLGIPGATAGMEASYWAPQVSQPMPYAAVSNPRQAPGSASAASQWVPAAGVQQARGGTAAGAGVQPPPPRQAHQQQQQAYVLTNNTTHVQRVPLPQASPEPSTPKPALQQQLMPQPLTQRQQPQPLPPLQPQQQPQVQQLLAAAPWNAGLASRESAVK